MVAKLEDLTSGAVVEGLAAGSPATIIAVVPHGPDTAEVVYRLADGKVEARLLTRQDEARLKLATGEAQWTFNADGDLFALYAFLGASDFEGAVLRAVRLGGDADTIGAMAGAAAGARWGYEAIPWRHKVEGHDRLVGLADRLFRRVQENLEAK